MELAGAQLALVSPICVMMIVAMLRMGADADAYGLGLSDPAAGGSRSQS